MKPTVPHNFYYKVTPQNSGYYTVYQDDSGEGISYTSKYPAYYLKLNDSWTIYQYISDHYKPVEIYHTEDMTKHKYHYWEGC